MNYNILQLKADHGVEVLICNKINGSVTYIVHIVKQIMIRELLEEVSYILSNYKATIRGRLRLFEIFRG